MTKKPEPEDREPRRAGPARGDFVVPSVPEGDPDERADALPRQEDFWRPPVRFGSIPVEKEPLGWDRRRGFRKLFPPVYLPFQVVERVPFGHSSLEPNRLFWGDNLHVMRQLPSESIDLIYLDPPFFSGRQYNVIFGDQNELRSFSDIWEDGMPGYLVWLNARLYEMKRLLKKSGSIYVHCDWHASHYIKVELDKLFGYECFQNEIIWCYREAINAKKRWNRKHDVILYYTRQEEGYYFDPTPALEPHSESTNKKYKYSDEKGPYRLMGRGIVGSPIRSARDVSPEWEKKRPDLVYRHYQKAGTLPVDYWNIDIINQAARERIGYPTQKPERLLERIVACSSPQGATVADFFSGGGTTAAVAQRLGRRWLACDQSRVAVAVTADRLTQQVEESTGALFPVPDFTIEHWGIYEARRLSEAPPDQFRAFVLSAFAATPEQRETGIHGYKGAVPVWVGDPNQKQAVSAREVQEFANGIRRTLRYKQDNLRDGLMLAWAFRPDAVEAAERLRRLEQTDLNFIRLETVRIDSPRFREHVTSLSTDFADYQSCLTFIQPPRVEVGYERVGPRTYRFDVSDSVVMNPGGKLINVQWDFNYHDRFSSTPGHSLTRGGKQGPELQVQHEFPHAGSQQVACKVQDDMGGEGIWIASVDVK